MAWSHSYAPEAYDFAMYELENWTREDLCKAIADFNYEHFHGDTFRKGHPHHKGPWSWEKIHSDPYISIDTLVDRAMKCIREVYTCDNGGWAMWIDYDGYHKVELPN
jgi:hypothetical protein